MVEKRKRMLQTFLNRVAKHPELGNDHVFHRFLESGVAWVSFDRNIIHDSYFIHFFFF